MHNKDRSANGAIHVVGRADGGRVDIGNRGRFGCVVDGWFRGNAMNRAVGPQENGGVVVGVGNAYLGRCPRL